MSHTHFGPDAIRMLARLLHEEGLSEIEMSEGDWSIRVVRAPDLQTAPSAAPIYQSHSLPLPSPPIKSRPDDQPQLEKESPGSVRSPMLGVVYLAPSPEAMPFVKQGQAVKKGQTLLLIEAMKTFNAIEAPLAGTLDIIAVEDGATVDVDDLLMVISPRI